MDLQHESLKLDNSSILFPSSILSNYQHYLRKASLFLLSLSLLSLFLSFFTGLSFLQSYTYYFTTFLLSFLTHTFERKYMFLLCNGILVFLAGKAGFSCSLSSELQMEETVEEDLVSAPVHPLYEEETKSSSVVTDGLLEIQEEEDEAVTVQMKEAVHQIMEDNFTEDGTLINEEVEFENEEENASVFVGGEEDDTQSEGPASNTEELNRKIEEFIRKMKEELSLEAKQQQLIAA